MKSIGYILLAVLLGLGALTHAAENTKSPAVLLQEAIYEEETAGNLDKAIELYGQVLQEAADMERLAARATYQLGLCHLKKGDQTTAADYFKKVVHDYPNQASVVKKAQTQLEKLGVNSDTENNWKWFDLLGYETTSNLSTIYGEICAEAGIKKLYSHSLIYVVNKDFVLCGGSMGYVYNWTDQPITENYRIFRTMISYLEFYDALGNKIDVKLTPDENNANYYNVYWNPVEPLKPGEFFYFSSAATGTLKLPQSADGSTYQWTMDNYFGDHCYETFFLIVPKGVILAKQSETYTNMKNSGNWDIYWWKKEVPQNTGHTVHVELKDPTQGILEDSFEEGDQVPTGWEKGAAVEGVSYIWDKNTGSDGKASLCLKKNVEKYFPIAQWTRKIEYIGNAKELTVSANVRAKKAYKAVIDALFLDDKGEWIKHEWVSYIGAKEAGDPPANHNWKDYSGTIQIPDNTKTIVVGLQMYGPGTVWFDELNVAYTDSTAGNPQMLVEDFFKHNFRDVTSRKTLEWGEPTTDENGNLSIRCKYEATIWDKDKVINDQVFTFDKDGKFVSVKDIVDASNVDSVHRLVEKFFMNNYRDITSRKPLEWGQPTTDENGNISIRYKYEATIRDKDKIINDETFTFDKDGTFISVLDTNPNPLKAEDLVQEGWKLWNQRKLVEAESKFQQAIRSDPDNEAAYQGLGWAQLNQGKKQNAEVSFKKCVKLNPGNSAALNGLGWIAYGQDKKPEAVKWWEKAIEAQPGATAALNGLTQTYMETEQYDKAVKYFQMWLKVEPENQQAREGLEKAKSMVK